MKTFPLDHFGAASAQALHILADASTTRRERARAFRALRDLAQISKSIDFDPVYIGVQTDYAGQLWLAFAPKAEETSPTHIPRVLTHAEVQALVNPASGLKDLL